jgi:hypothetical protein
MAERCDKGIDDELVLRLRFHHFLRLLFNASKMAIVPQFVPIFFQVFLNKEL